MPAMPSNLPDPETVTTVAVLTASLCVIYWRTALRLLVITLIALAIYGAFLAFYGLQHVAK
jgi:hypothetical protein